MKLCFYNMNHIGDVYIFASMFNLLCKSNEYIDLYYFIIQGDTYFNNVLGNQYKLGDDYSEYKGTLINGSPPENMLNNTMLTFLINNNLQHKQFTCLKMNDQDILFINTWCASPIIKHIEFDLHDAIRGWNVLINNFNVLYNFNLKFENINKNNLFNKDKDKDTELYIEKSVVKEDIIFIFNYKPRSIKFNMNRIVNDLIIRLSISNKVVLSCYDDQFNNNKNVDFLDRKYNIFPDPACINLNRLWDIIINFKTIYITMSGSNWTFFHKLKYIKKGQIIMMPFNKRYNRYLTTLNKNISWLLDDNDTYITKLLST